MSNPIYGAKVHHRLIDHAGPVVIQGLTAAGAAISDLTAAVYASPEITDITYKMLGKMEEQAGTVGNIAHIEISQEGVEITFTLLPNAATKANALLGSNVFRVGSPVKISGAPVVMAPGHADTAASPFDDLLNTGTLGTHPTAWVTSHDIKMSTNGDTTGTITVRRYVGMTSVAAVTA